MEAVVADSTCLIGLERIGKLNILPALFEPIAIPNEVEREFGIFLPWLKTETPKNFALISSLKILVDDGEAEAIALALEKNCKVILDDKQARSVANRLGLEVIGTVGILIKAKENGLIDSIKNWLDALDANGFRLSKSLKEEALKIVNE